MSPFCEGGAQGCGGMKGAVGMHTDSIKVQKRELGRRRGKRRCGVAIVKGAAGECMAGKERAGRRRQEKAKGGEEEVTAHAGCVGEAARWRLWARGGRGEGERKLPAKRVTRRNSAPKLGHPVSSFTGYDEPMAGWEELSGSS